MKRKIVIILIFFVVFILGFQSYNLINYNRTLFNSVINKEGYSLQSLGKQPIEFFIKPEWIPNKSEVRKKVNQKLVKLHNTNLKLVDVTNNEWEMCFNMTTTYKFNQKEGKFMYIYLLNDDDTVTSNMSQHDYVLLDNKNNEIEMGSMGSGPDSDFSFCLDPENQKQILDGFKVKYNGFYLYKFTKND
ncbi:MAG: hypothetical protein ABWX61_09155 [Paenisporosarcina sp.]